MQTYPFCTEDSVQPQAANATSVTRTNNSSLGSLTDIGKTGGLGLGA